MPRRTIPLTTAAIIITAALSTTALSTAAMAHGSPGEHSGPGQAIMNSSQSMGNKGPGGQNMGGQTMNPAKGMNMMMNAMRSMMKNQDANTPLDKPLTIGDVQTHLKRYLQHRGNDRLKIGDVKNLNDKTIIAKIVTKDGSVVEQFKIDKTTGRWTSDNK